MNDEKNFYFTLTADEANIVLQGLSNLPFAQVFKLIGKIQEQAEKQMRDTVPVEVDKQA
jgi:hypothetical protein